MLKQSRVVILCQTWQIWNAWNRCFVIAWHLPCRHCHQCQLNTFTRYQLCVNLLMRWATGFDQWCLPFEQGKCVNKRSEFHWRDHQSIGFTHDKWVVLGSKLQFETKTDRAVLAIDRSVTDHNRLKFNNNLAKARQCNALFSFLHLPSTAPLIFLRSVK